MKIPELLPSGLWLLFFVFLCFFFCFCFCFSFSRCTDPRATICHQGLRLPGTDLASAELVSVAPHSMGFGGVLGCSLPGEGSRGLGTVTSKGQDKQPYRQTPRCREKSAERLTVVERHKWHHNTDTEGSTHSQGHTHTHKVPDTP